MMSAADGLSISDTSSGIVSCSLMAFERRTVVLPGFICHFGRPQQLFTDLGLFADSLIDADC
jgi:hypothetical protein